LRNHPDDPDIMTPDTYLRPEAFARERRAIFANEWLIVGRGAKVAEAGNYLAISYGGWSVIAVRDGRGRLGAFQNICRHQGLPVLDGGSGNCASLKCRYHGWTYDLDGRFLSASPLSMPADPADPMHNLRPAQVAEWNGLVLVNFNDKAAALTGIELFETTARQLAGLEIQDEVAVAIDANWKVALEHTLASAVDMFWVWPNLVVQRAGAAIVIHEIAPVTFKRTRVVRHLYAASGGPTAAARGETEQAGEIQKSAANAAQLAYEGGAPLPAPTGLVEAFRARLRGVHPAG
jgi:phenylpropionate dioxygenase-like ring-hydroxylating dioxygenase large terminal subunit